MKINIAFDQIDSYNLEKTLIGKRFKHGSQWIEHSVESVQYHTISDCFKYNYPCVYPIGTIGGPKWYLKQRSDKDRGIFFNNLPKELIEHCKNDRAMIHLDQTMEGFPLLEQITPYNKPFIIDYYKIIHDNLQRLGIHPSRFLFSTSNLLEPDLYQTWCNNNDIKDKINIISLPFFACATQQRGFFDWTDKPDLRDDPHDVDYDTQVNYKANNKIKLFNCLNRVNRTHRSALICMLNHYNLINGNIVSHDYLPKEFLECVNIDNWSHHASFSGSNFTDIKNKLPLVHDMSNFQVNHAQNFNKQIYCDTWFSLITETLYEDWKPTIFFSEKIFKPMRAHHPFVLVSHTRSIEYLKKIGFKTFDKWWDESYDTIDDPVVRMDKICELVLKLKKKSQQEWLTIYQEMKPVLEHNYRHLLDTNWFQEPFRKIITEYYEI